MRAAPILRPMTETEACIALNMVPNVGPVRLRKLLDVFETPEAILRKGTTTVTLSQTITVPATASSVNALFPLFIDGINNTRAVAVRNYPVR